MNSKFFSFSLNSIIIYSLLLLLILSYNKFKFCSSSPTNLNNIQNVLLKLETFVKESKQQSGLTINEIKSAEEEFKILNLDKRYLLESKRPLFRLISDLLLIPMEKFPEMVDATGQAYITRLEANYKELRPAYLGESIGMTYTKADKIDNLISSLLELQNYKPLTNKMLIDASNEYKAFVLRANEIGKLEDIFSCKKELINIFNLLNREMVQILGNTIFPFIEKNDYNLDSLREVYKKELMDKYSIAVENGELVRIMRQF